MNKLTSLMKRWEGYRQYVYLDQGNHEHLGIGRCIKKGVGIGISEEEAEYLLSNDIARVEAELSGALPWFAELEGARRDGMISMGFQLGLTKLLKFKMALKSMEDKDYSGASLNFMDSLWARQTPIRALEVCSMIEKGRYEE